MQDTEVWTPPIWVKMFLGILAAIVLGLFVYLVVDPEHRADCDPAEYTGHILYIYGGREFYKRFGRMPGRCWQEQQAREERNLREYDRMPPRVAR